MSVVGGISKNSKLKGEDLAPIAVDIYNREKKAQLEFWKVLDDSRTERVDDGMRYYIIFKAANGGSMNTYIAKVLVHLVFKDADPVTPAPVDDIYVKFAEFSVDEHNLKLKTPQAVLWKVLTADEVPEKIDKDGITYFIILKTVEGHLVGTHEADVSVKLEDLTLYNAATSA